MKILKKAAQKNVILNKDYYTVRDVNEMLKAHIVWRFGERCTISYEEVTAFEYDEADIRIFTENLSELKVILNDDLHYETVAIGKNGKQYFVLI